MAYVFIVDDDEDFADATARVLRTDGHEVQIALDTKSAAVAMEEKRPDLAILDVMFPEDSSAGFELARKMRHESESLKDVPILMLTAVNVKFPLGFGPQDIDDAWMPVTDFVEKPVDFDVLRAKVSALLKDAGSET
jgi:DNA-binding response OmpR family regulator